MSGGQQGAVCSIGGAQGNGQVGQEQEQWEAALGEAVEMAQAVTLNPPDFATDQLKKSLPLEKSLSFPGLSFLISKMEIIKVATK